MKLSFGITVLTLALLGAMPYQASAQETPVAPQYRNAISANPFGLLLEFFNAEYERVVSESSTLGVGGSTISSGDDRYTNGDVFFRYYPSGQPLEGWAFGAKAGLTRVPDSGTYFGLGFDVNHSWLMGKKDNFYVGLGIGLKRLVGVPEEDDLSLQYVPTFRIINIGFAF